MIRRALSRFTLPAVLFITAGFALPAYAEGDGSAPTFNGGVYLFGRDVPVFGASTSGGSAGVIGLGYQMNIPTSKTSPWGWTIGADYGIGDSKVKSSNSGTSSTSELSLTQWSIHGGMLYYHKCCDDWYCGPEIMYLSTVPTFKDTGFPDDKLKPTNTYAFDAKVGGSIPMGPKWKLFGELNSLLGYSTYKETQSGTTIEANEWMTTETWLGGVRINY